VIVKAGANSRLYASSFGVIRAENLDRDARRQNTICDRAAIQSIVAPR